MIHKIKIFKDIIEDIVFSFMFFTILPLFKYINHNQNPNYTRSQWAFPIVGILIGLIVVLIVKISFFLGLNLIISSTIGVLINIYIIGFFGNKQISGFAEKLNTNDLRIQSIETKNYLFLVLLIFLKIHLIAELFKVEGFLFVITGCCALGTFSIVLIRKIIDSYNDEYFSTIIGKSSVKNLLISTLIVFLTILPLGLMITTILLIVVYSAAFFLNIFLSNFNYNKNIKSIGIYAQIVEIISLIILNMWLSI